MPGEVLTEVANGVWVAHSAVYDATTTVVVDAHGSALVVDPGVLPSELARLAAEVRERGWHVSAGFATHAHWDHVLWNRALGDAPRWARPGAVAAAEAGHAALLAEAAVVLGEPDDDLREEFAQLTPLRADRGEVPGVGVRAVVIGHEAHARGHAALLLPDAGVLVAGDMLSDVEVPLLDLAAADPVTDYVVALDRLAHVLEGVDVVIPGHGAVADREEARRRLALDRSYLDDLRAGRPSSDPRLARAPAWLLAQHEAQARDLSRRGLLS